MVMAWVGDAVRMTTAPSLPICKQDITPTVGASHDGTWIASRTVSDEITIFQRMVPVCRNLT